jgi:hypothetical protein
MVALALLSLIITGGAILSLRLADSIRDSVDTSTERFLVGTMAQIAERISRALSAAQSTAAIDAALIGAESVGRDEPTWPTTLFLAQLGEDERLSGVRFADTTGALVSVLRRSDGGLRPAIIGAERFDARVTRWYFEALDSRTPSWTFSAVPALDGSRTYSAIRPVYGDSGTLLGVVAVDTATSELAEAISTPLAMVAGIGFISDDGGIVATVVSGHDDGTPVADAEDELMRETARHLFGSDEVIARFQIGEERYLAGTRSIVDPYGLEWRLSLVLAVDSVDHVVSPKAIRVPRFAVILIIGSAVAGWLAALAAAYRLVRPALPQLGRLTKREPRSRPEGPINLALVMGHAVRRLGLRGTAKRQLASSVEGRTPWLVEGDQTILVEVITRLLKKALRARRPDRPLEVSVDGDVDPSLECMTCGRQIDPVSAKLSIRVELKPRPRSSGGGPGGARDFAATWLPSEDKELVERAGGHSALATIGSDRYEISLFLPSAQSGS